MSQKFEHVMYADDTTLISTLENFGPTNNAKELLQTQMTRFPRLQLGFNVRSCN